MFGFNKKRIYLDYSAATPLSAEAYSAMKPYFEENFGNPSSLHKEGLRARLALKEARERVAQSLGARAEEIIFTGGGTESNNMAIFGFFENLKKKGKSFENLHAITSEAEHSSVLQCFKKLEREGLSVDYVKILPSGLLDMSDFKTKLKKETVFGSFMLVNNEIGTILPLREISKLFDRFAKQNNIEKIILHTDAVQAPLYIEINPHSLGVDMLTLDGAKLYGPKGSGLLYKRKQVELSSIVEGGAQERGLRPGTPNVPVIIGLSVALSLAVKDRKAESERLSKMRDTFLKELNHVAPHIKLVGTIGPRIANNINIFIPKIESEFAVIKLDHMGFAVSSASACQLEGPQGSYVTTIALKEATQEGSAIRITMGRDTTYSDLKGLLKAIQKLVN